jgi:hypothetical protein
MRIASQLVLFVVIASLTILSARAQFTYSFVTQLGSGSLTLNTNNLVGGGDVNSAAYTDTLDSLTFNGITYTNLYFTVWNNFNYLASHFSGFQIFVNKSPYGSAGTLELNVWGNNSSVVNGTSVSDLLTVLSSFNLFEFERDVEFDDPSLPGTQDGTIASFQLLSPSTINSFGIQTNCFGFNIAGNTNATVVVEACTNVTNPVWVPVQTNILTSGSIYFSDPGWTNYTDRFYRLRSP